MSEHQANAIRYICTALAVITLFICLAYSDIKRANACHCDQVTVKP